MNSNNGVRLLVTGGSGFIGSNLMARALETPGLEVLSIDKRAPRVGVGSRAHCTVDLLDIIHLRRVIRSFQPSHVIHLAARTDLMGKTLDDYADNTVGTSNLIAALSETQRLERVVFASSRLVCKIGYRPVDDLDFLPSHPYGSSKVAMERSIRSSAVPASWTIVRPTSIWGPYFSVPYADFFNHVLAGRYVHPRGLRVLKSFGYVENTVEQIMGILYADHQSVSERVFYLADYVPIEVLSFARFLAKASGAPRVREVPLWTLSAAARVGDLARLSRLYRNPPLTSFRLNNLLTEMTFDMRATQEIVPSLPVDRDEGIRRTLRWLQGEGEGRLPKEA